MTSSDPVPKRVRPPIEAVAVRPPLTAYPPQKPPKREVGRWAIGIGVCVLAVVLVVSLVYVVAKLRTPAYVPEPAHDVTYWYTATGGARSLELDITYTYENGERTDTASSLTPLWRKDTRSSVGVLSLALTVQPKGLDGKQDVTIGPFPLQFRVACGIDVDGRSATVQRNEIGCTVGVSLPVKSPGPSGLAPTAGS